MEASEWTYSAYVWVLETLQNISNENILNSGSDSRYKKRGPDSNTEKYLCVKLKEIFPTIIVLYSRLQAAFCHTLIN